MEKIDIFKLEHFPLKNLSQEDKILLLKELGFDSDGIYILNKGGERIYDKYLGVPVRIDNMLIFPGSTIILDDNELSITMYIQEYADVFG